LFEHQIISEGSCETEGWTSDAQLRFDMTGIN